MMPFVTGIIGMHERHVDPPFASDFVAEEDDVFLSFSNLYVKPLEIIAFHSWEVILTVAESLYEIPNHLGNQIGCARIDVVMGIVFEETDR